jgi:hypothetical protein
MTEDPQGKSLEPGSRVELMIVASGARRDLGQYDAAVALLQVPALEGPVREWTARLRYAYADALLDAQRAEEARQWFARAAEVDSAGETDAEDRLLELDGVVMEDLQDDDVDQDTPLGTAELAALVATAPVEAPDALSDLATAAQDVVTEAPAVEEPFVAPVEVPSEELRPEIVGPAVTVAGTDGVPGQPLWRAAVAQDEEIPALGRVGTTALGFMSVQDEPVEDVGGPASAQRDAEPGVDDADTGEQDDLRLFD